MVVGVLYCLLGTSDAMAQSTVTATAAPAVAEHGLSEDVSAATGTFVEDAGRSQRPDLSELGLTEIRDKVRQALRDEVAALEDWDDLED